MPNGKPGDNPISDLLLHGMHPFPSDMERMLRRLYELDPALLAGLTHEPFEWERGTGLVEGRALLRQLLECHEGPADRHLPDRG